MSFKGTPHPRSKVDRRPAPDGRARLEGRHLQHPLLSASRSRLVHPMRSTASGGRDQAGKSPREAGPGDGHGRRHPSARGLAGLERQAARLLPPAQLHLHRLALRRQQLRLHGCGYRFPQQHVVGRGRGHPPRLGDQGRVAPAQPRPVAPGQGRAEGGRLDLSSLQRSRLCGQGRVLQVQDRQACASGACQRHQGPPSCAVGVAEQSRPRRAGRPRHARPGTAGREERPGQQPGAGPGVVRRVAHV